MTGQTILAEFDYPRAFRAFTLAGVREMHFESEDHAMTFKGIFGYGVAQRIGGWPHIDGILLKWPKLSDVVEKSAQAAMMAYMPYVHDKPLNAEQRIDNAEKNIAELFVINRTLESRLNIALDLIKRNRMDVLR